MFMFHLSFHATPANSPFALVFMSSCLKQRFLQNVIRHYFSIWSESTAAILLFICKLLNKSGEEKETVPTQFLAQTSNLCSTPWHSCADCSHSSTWTLLSLPNQTNMFYVYMAQNSTVSSLWPQTTCVSWVLSLSQTFLIFHNLT
jgi:hypothetical protein